MTNREEFIFESKPTMVTVETPEVPQQCGIETGVELSKLSKTQKKKSKAKAKINNVNQMLKDSDQYKLFDIPLQQNDKIDIKKKTIPPLGKPITFEGLDFSNDPFKEKTPLPKCVVKCDDEIFKSIEPIIQQLFGQL